MHSMMDCEGSETCSSRETSAAPKVLDDQRVKTCKRLCKRRQTVGPEEVPFLDDRIAKRDSLLPPQPKRRAPKLKLQCCKCSELFKSQEKFCKHLYEHRSKKDLACAQCGKFLGDVDALYCHERNLHNFLRLFPCPYCIHTFRMLCHLEDHINSVHLDKRPYKCKLCSKAFYRWHDLKRHLNCHFGLDAYICEVCGQKFNHPSNLTVHYRSHSSAAPYVCNVCSKRFQQVSALHSHKLSHSENIRCPYCVLSCDKLCSLRNHIHIAHGRFLTMRALRSSLIKANKFQGIRHYYCSLCGLKYRFKDQLQLHLKTHKNSRVEQRDCTCAEEFSDFSCEIHRNNVNNVSTVHGVPSGNKGHSLSSASEFSAIQEANGVNITHCSDNGSDTVFVIGHDIQNDIGITIEEDPTLFSDVEENKPCVNILLAETELIGQNLQEETTMIVQPVELLQHSKGYKCSDVKHKETVGVQNMLHVKHAQEEDEQTEGSLQAVDSKNDRDRQIKAVFLKDRKPRLPKKVERGLCMYSCPECGKKFSRKWNYDQHIGTHDTSLHLYKCKLCPSSFAYRSSYSRHLRKHNPNPPVFKCLDCSRIYETAGGLHSHKMKNHARVTRHTCDLCGRKFFSKSEFSYHQRAHLKIYPYMCSVCGRKFLHISHLNKHERCHSLEKEHKCTFCAKTFSQASHLKSHMKTHAKSKRTSGEEGASIVVCTEKTRFPNLVLPQVEMIGWHQEDVPGSITVKDSTVSENIKNGGYFIHISGRSALAQGSSLDQDTHSPAGRVKGPEDGATEVVVSIVSDKKFVTNADLDYDLPTIERTSLMLSMPRTDISEDIHRGSQSHNNACFDFIEASLDFKDLC